MNGDSKDEVAQGLIFQIFLTGIFVVVFDKGLLGLLGRALSDVYEFDYNLIPMKPAENLLSLALIIAAEKM